MKLTKNDYLVANDAHYLELNPIIRDELIKSEKGRPPKECMECIFFNWLFENKKIIGGLCAVKPDIAKEKFLSHGIVDECPLKEVM